MSGTNQKANKGDQVEVDYTGRLTTGQVFDSSEGNDPLVFEAGSANMITGFSAAVIGMSVGEKKTVKISPEEAYGDRREELVVKFSKDQAPENVQVGQQLVGSAEDGQQVPLTVVEVGETEVTLDANHPLAGQELEFDITLKAIK